MFGRYAIVPKIVKIDGNKKDNSKTQTPPMEADDIIGIIEMSEAAVKDLVVLGVAAFAVVISLKTASEVIVNYAPKN